MRANQNDKQWDVFICHASEDKDSFVRPLAVALNQLGTAVWYDEFSLRPGDSISRGIDRGLAKSRFGIVVISQNFIGKAWPERELGGLVSREIHQGRVIIPIWHCVTRMQILEFSPTIADKLAIRTEHLSPQDISIQVLREIRPDLYNKHPRCELERLASGEAVKLLKQELERAKEEMLEYICPFCGAPLVEQGGESVGPSLDHHGVHKLFACGYRAFDGFTERPCPSDPKFPDFEEYELQSHHSPSETYHAWCCFGFPKTDMARRLSLEPAYGRTKAEAEQQLRAKFQRSATKYSV